MWSWLRRLFGDRAEQTPAESDVADDPHVARRRPTGGEHGRDDGDSAGTTGPGANDTFVGRVAGEDSGAVGTTGSEARTFAEHRRARPR